MLDKPPIGFMSFDIHDHEEYRLFAFKMMVNMFTF